MSGHLPLNALRVFDAAARHLSFRQAADELFVTPAAVSQQIKSLESVLGVQLFERRHGGLVLTAAGEAGLPALRAGLAQMKESVRRMRESERGHRLRVWAAPSFAAKWLMPRLDGFLSSRPDIELSISASSTLIDSPASRVELSVEMLRVDDIDIAVRFGRGNYPGCHVEKLMSAVVLPLCSPELLENPERPLRTPSDLRHHTLLHDDTPYEGRPDWATWMKAAGVDDVNSSRGVRFNSVLLGLAAAIDGQGVVLSIEQLAADDIAKGRLVCPFSPVLKLEFAYWVISRLEIHEEPDIVAFREWIAADAAASGADR